MRMGTIRERGDSMAGNTSQPSIKRVWGIAKSPELKLTDEELHLLVQAHTGKDSIKALNKRELQTVIRVLGNMKDSAKKSERGRNRYSGSEVTENQRKKIYKLTQELGWDKPARVNGMCQKMFGVSAVEWLNYQQCSKLIEALTSKAASVRKEKESKTTTTKETYTSERWGKEGGTTIHQISFTVDISKIKDLPLLYKLIDELKDAQNRTDSPTPATT